MRAAARRDPYPGSAWANSTARVARRCRWLAEPTSWAPPRSRRATPPASAALIAPGAAALPAPVGVLTLPLVLCAFRSGRLRTGLRDRLRDRLHGQRSRGHLVAAHQG